ncbi:MAG: acetate--CoA ligase family protein, partial [Candidatus Heimdallarchaeota archaeon]|nr:acetate--CoA ligase family protein [Candidatus Heimdallarchaeota archaeon]
MNTEITKILEICKNQGKTVLSYEESRTIMSLAGFPLNKMEIAVDSEDCLVKAKKIGYPVVLKLISADMLHKTDVGGVIINIDDAGDVRKSYQKILENAKKHGNIRVDGILVEETLCGRQVIVGSTRDPQFGPVLMF